MQFGLLDPKWPIARIQAKNPNAGPKLPRSEQNLADTGQTQLPTDAL